MRIIFSNTLLCSSDPAGSLGPVNPTFNGQPIVDIAHFLGADFATVFERGDGAVEFSFAVQRKFASEAEVIAFCATHRESLPRQADLVLTDDEQTVAATLADAVRSVRIAEILGTTVVVAYTFTGSRFETDDVPAAPTEGDTVKTYEFALSTDDEEKAVVFTTPFGATPKFVRGEITGPASADGGESIDAKPINSTRTAEGVTFEFTAKIPGSGYSLLVFAAL